MATYIAHAKQNEHGTTKGGQPGDQTGLEVMTEPWYLRGSNGVVWDVVYRPNNDSVGERIAAMAEQIANNEHIGYNQDNRLSLYDQLVSVGFNPQLVTVNCDCDCSSMVACCCIGAGLQISPSMTTYVEDGALMSTGQFTRLTDVSYTQSGDNLKRGDILHRSGHTAVVIQNQSTQATPTPPIGFRMWMGWTPYESIYEYTDVRGLYVIQTTGEAYGRYQFDYRYGLVDFMTYCIAHDSVKYGGFQTYVNLGVGNTQLVNNSGLIALFKQYATDYTIDFAYCQDQCMLDQYYNPARNYILTHYGWDVENKGVYAVGSLASLAIRYGYESGAKLFSDGATMDELTLCHVAYQRMGQIYFDGGRWQSGGSYSQYDRLDRDYNSGGSVYALANGSLPYPSNPDNPNDTVINPTPFPEPDARPGPSTGNGKNPLWVLTLISGGIPYF